VRYQPPKGEGEGRLSNYKVDNFPVGENDEGSITQENREGKFKGKERGQNFPSLTGRKA